MTSPALADDLRNLDLRYGTCEQIRRPANKLDDLEQIRRPAIRESRLRNGDDDDDDWPQDIL